MWLQYRKWRERTQEIQARGSDKERLCIES